MHFVLCLWLGSIGADPSAALRQALTLEQSGNHARALQAVEAVIRSQPQWELPRLEAARLRLKTGAELDLAQMHLEAARSVAPENPRGHFLWAQLMEERGDPAAAIASLTQALIYRSDYTEARFRLASLHFARSEWDKAERHYRFLARSGGDANVRLQLAAALEKMGRLEDCERELRKLLDDEVEPVLAARRLAEFYDRTDRPKLADKVRKEHPPSPPAKRKMRELKKSRR
jgi:tetratricopeptide (TPR) repeat protein